MRALGWHVVAHAREDRLPLDSEGPCRWLWQHLKERWPDALGCTLMPNHVHLVTPKEPDSGELAKVLANQAAVAGSRQTWLPVPSPQPLVSTDKLARSLRYVALNPCRPFRHGQNQLVLVEDPLVWPWSTHRDLAGAIVEPWVHADRLADTLRRPREGMSARWHRYVSADSWVTTHGTETPRTTRPRATARLDLEELAWAVQVATRSEPEALQRRGPTRTLFLAAAALGGWRDKSVLAQRASCSPRTVRRASARLADLTAVLTCLGDERLLRPQTPTLSARRVSKKRTLRASEGSRSA